MRKIQEIFNFDNIGVKIQNFAKWSCWITILLTWIGAAITFLVFLFIEGMFQYAFLVPVGAAIGSLLIWVSSWVMYAFGEYIENIQAIRNQIPKINNIDRNLQTIAQQANETAKHEAEEWAKQQAEAITKRNAEEKAEHDTEEKVNREAKKNAEQVAQKKEKNLSETLEYALKFQTDNGMLDYLRGIQDETVQDILKSPQHLIREKIQNILANM